MFSHRVLAIRAVAFSGQGHAEVIGQEDAKISAPKQVRKLPPGPKDAAQVRRETIHRQRKELRQQRECISDLKGQLSDLRRQHKVALELRELQHKMEKQEEVDSVRAKLLDDVAKLQAKVVAQNVILESIKQLRRTPHPVIVV